MTCKGGIMNFALHIERSCQTNPDKTCVVQGDFRLTYGQVEERANRLARALFAMGLKAGDRVAIFQTNCFQFAEMIYAVAKVGGIFLNLNFRLRGEETSYILSNAEPKILILGDRYVELIKNIRPQLPFIKNHIVIGMIAIFILTTLLIIHIQYLQLLNLMVKLML
jgi:acyl-CoA synthetase (AMP-forming)/AMP-acid ligase II